MQKERLLHYGFFTILFFQGFIWLQSGVEKIMGGAFPRNLAVTLEKFASNNPNGFYKNLLTTQGIPNAQNIGNVVMWTEVIVGSIILISTFYLFMHIKGNRLFEILLVIGLLIGFFLNLNFWLASGWMSPSGSGLNMLMMVVQAVGTIVILF